MELIDVFDMEGNYIDYFYLKYPENNEYHGPFNNLITDDGYLFAPRRKQRQRAGEYWEISDCG